MAYLIRLLHAPYDVGEFPGPYWLRSFDVATEEVVFTSEAGEALEFPDFEAVEAAWCSPVPGTGLPALQVLELAAQEIGPALQRLIDRTRKGR